MPVSNLLEVVSWVQNFLEIGVSLSEVAVLTYLVFGGGWLDMIRLISFWLDVLIIKYVDKFYLYFEKILGGRIFNPDVVNEVMNRIYIFVSLFVLLKLLMLFIKYLMNPEMVSDDKVGAQALIKRVIFGMCGILMLPTIFNMSVRLQEAVLNDNIFGRMLLTEKQLQEYQKNKNQMGRVLAFNVYQAFWSLDTKKVTDQKIIEAYKAAIKNSDPTMIGITAISEKYGDDYAYDYFPFASSVILAYVLYLVIKYCIDVVVRTFKLFLLQMVGPLAISDYMVNGDSKELFKNWLKTTISVYAMLFVRIFSIWFIAFITLLMQTTCTGDTVDGVCTDSLLYVVDEPDYLLKGIITLGLLAVLMDLPKFFSDLFGLDLEQDATVKGIMQKAGSAAKSIGTTGLAVGGAAIGGAIGGAVAGGKNAISAAKGLASNRKQNKENLMKSNPELAKKNAAIMQKQEALKSMKKNGASKEEQKAAKNDLKAAKNDLKSTMKGKELKKSPEMKAYRASNRMAGVRAANKITGGLTGGVTGTLASLGNSMLQMPGVKDAVSNFNLGQNAINKKEQAMGKVDQAFDMVKKPIEVNAIIKKVNADGAKAATEKVEMTGQVNKFETAKAEEKVEMTGQVNKIETANSEKPVVEMTGQVNEVNVQNVGEQTIDVSANVTTDDQNKTQ